MSTTTDRSVSYNDLTKIHENMKTPISVVQSTVPSIPSISPSELFLKDQELKFREQELKLKEQEFCLKMKEKEYEFNVSFNVIDKLKSKELEYLLARQNIKYRESECQLKATENATKLLENERYAQETKHQERFNALIEASLSLQNIEKRLMILNEIGLKLNNESDFEYIVRLSKLLGHEINEGDISNLEVYGKKIMKNKEVTKSMYS